MLYKIWNFAVSEVTASEIILWDSYLKEIVALIIVFGHF